MNTDLLRKHINEHKNKLQSEPEKYGEDLKERWERRAYYQSWTKERLVSMDENGLYDYVSKLWAMLIWGNKHYVVDKLIEDNGFATLKNELAALLWGTESIPERWDHFRKAIKGMGPAMMSELLCHVHPDEYMLWNRRAYVGLNYLGVPHLPRYDYQMTGERYAHLSAVAKTIAGELAVAGIETPDLLSVDYFLWDELQVEENLSQLFTGDKIVTGHQLTETNESSEVAVFIHNEVRDKLSDIGRWLGFDSKVEKKVADGAKVDTIWEATIGNMGRIIYVFEVQTKGSIDSLILNLLKSMNNPAVQGVVAVSDSDQLEKIRKHAGNVGTLDKNLKFWDYREVLQVHEALQAVNESINKLGLVPEGFWPSDY